MENTKRKLYWLYFR